MLNELNCRWRLLMTETILEFEKPQSKQNKQTNMYFHPTVYFVLFIHISVTSNVDKTRNTALMYKQFLYVFLLQIKHWIKSLYSFP